VVCRLGIRITVECLADTAKPVGGTLAPLQLIKTCDPIKLLAEPIAQSRGLIGNSLDEAAVAEFHVDKKEAGNHDDREAWDRHGVCSLSIGAS
jgi:hypothetical protein